MNLGAASALGAAPALLVGCAMLYRHQRRRRFLALLDAVTRQHARLLSVKRNQLVIHDGYGNTRLEGWIKHVDYFLDHVVAREAQARGRSAGDIAPGSRFRREAIRRFLSVLQQHEDETGTAAPERDSQSGQRYEQVCQRLLQAAGWSVATTPASGDQGADLIADRAGCRLVVQCKFHARPIGNKAVQEAYAALPFHAGHRAAVVSNQPFTRSAQALAGANGVLLLHHDQLRDLDVARLRAR